MGFRAVAKHRQKDVTLYKQGDVNFIINAEPGLFGRKLTRAAMARASARWRFA